jgi:hypothetical protein
MKVRGLLFIATVLAAIGALAAPAANADVFTYSTSGTSTGCSEDVYVSGMWRMIINNTFAESGDRYVSTVRFVLTADAVGVTTGTKYEIVSVQGQMYMEYPVIEDRLRTATWIFESRLIGNGEVYRVRILTHVTFSGESELIALVDRFEVGCL